MEQDVLITLNFKISNNKTIYEEASLLFKTLFHKHPSLILTQTDSSEVYQYLLMLSTLSVFSLDLLRLPYTKVAEAIVGLTLKHLKTKLEEKALISKADDSNKFTNKQLLKQLKVVNKEFKYTALEKYYKNRYSEESGMDMEDIQDKIISLYITTLKLHDKRNLEKDFPQFMNEDIFIDNRKAFINNRLQVDDLQ